MAEKKKPLIIPSDRRIVDQNGQLTAHWLSVLHELVRRNNDLEARLAALGG